MKYAGYFTCKYFLNVLWLNNDFIAIPEFGNNYHECLHLVSTRYG